MGNFGNYINQSFPPKPKFSAEDVPDLTGKIVLVTGGNSGIGYETIKAILPKNAKVYMASRSKEKAEAAILKLEAETGERPLFLHLDLSNKDSVRKAAEDFKSKETELHILFNNGGVMIPPINELTNDGYDLQFGTNVIGPYLLTTLLLPLLIAGAQSSPDKKARVVNTSSSAQMFVDKIDFETIRDTPARKKLGPAKLYMQSKFATVVFSNELARRYGDKGIVSTSLNPGNLNTGLQRHTPSVLRGFLGLFFHPAPIGALTQLWAGTSPETVNFNGKYLIPWAREGTIRPETQDPQVGEQLWTWLEKATRVETSG